MRLGARPVTIGQSRFNDLTFRLWGGFEVEASPPSSV